MYFCVHMLVGGEEGLTGTSSMLPRKGETAEGKRSAIVTGFLSKDTKGS